MYLAECLVTTFVLTDKIQIECLGPCRTIDAFIFLTTIAVYPQWLFDESFYSTLQFYLVSSALVFS